MKPPTPEQIAEARAVAPLTQTQAAALVHTSARTWTRWEQGRTQMHPAIWTLFLLRIGQHPTRLLTKRQTF